MKSGMDSRPMNRHEIFNLTLLSGCRVIDRRDVGLVTSKEFGDAFFPAIQTALRTKGIRVHSFNSMEDFYS